MDIEVPVFKDGDTVLWIQDFSGLLAGFIDHNVIEWQIKEELNKLPVEQRNRVVVVPMETSYRMFELSREFSILEKPKNKWYNSIRDNLFTGLVAIFLGHPGGNHYAAVVLEWLTVTNTQVTATALFLDSMNPTATMKYHEPLLKKFVNA